MSKQTISFSDKLTSLFPTPTGEWGDMQKKTGVRDITMQITEDCNLRCSYCYQHDKTHEKMSLETGKKFIDLILASDERTAGYIKSRECTGCVLNFIGGEPFLEIDLIDQLTDYFIKRMIELDHPWLFRYRISICSNGVLYFSDKVQKYLQKNIGRISLTITIDGDKKLHDMCRLDEFGNGSYDRAIAAVQDWNKKSQTRSGTKLTISPDNLPLLQESLKYFIDSGEEEIYCNCVFEEGWTKEHANSLYYQLKNVADYLLDHDYQDDYFISILDLDKGRKYTSDLAWCGGNGLMLCVDPKGDIYPCLRYTPSSIGHKQELYIIGDVDHGIMYDEITTKRVTDMDKITRTSQCKGTECESCPISQGCADCAGYSYEVFGEVGHRTTFICDTHKAEVLAQVYYKNKCYLKTGKKTYLPMNCPKGWALEIIDENEYNYLAQLAKEAEECANIS